MEQARTEPDYPRKGRANPVVCEGVITSLRRLGGSVTVNSIGEIRDELDLMQYSKTEVKKAMGSLVDRRMVIRSRRGPEGITDAASPMTFRLNT